MVDRKLVEAKSQLLGEYQLAYGQVGGNKYASDTERVKEALRIAITKVKSDINKKEGTYAVIKRGGEGNTTGAPAYATDLKELGDDDTIGFSLQDFSDASFDWSKLVQGGTTEKVVPNSRINSWVTELTNSNQVTSYNLIDDIATELPSDHPLYGKPRLIIKDLMTNGVNATDASKEAAKKIVLDNKDHAVILLGSDLPNVKRKLSQSPSNGNLIRLLGFSNYVLSTGTVPFDPGRLNTTKKERSY